MLNKLKNNILRIIWESYYLVTNPFANKNTIKVAWDKKYNNFGDILTPYILNKITDKKIERIEKSLYYPSTHYLMIGSIIERANKNSIIWGSGLLSEEYIPLKKPKKINAVRGPKTREILLNLGMECPEIYGDPALLLPKFYNPVIEKEYKLGIIPHYKDKNISWIKNISNVDIKIIDIQVDDPRKFIDDVLSCEKIASSSLHGIITADAYSIPSLWLEFSKNVVGNGFKFYDYFLSVGRLNEKVLLVNDETKIETIINSFHDYNISIDLDKLYDSCPLLAKYD